MNTAVLIPTHSAIDFAKISQQKTNKIMVASSRKTIPVGYAYLKDFTDLTSIPSSILKTDTYTSKFLKNDRYHIVSLRETTTLITALNKAYPEVNELSIDEIKNAQILSTHLSPSVLGRLLTLSVDDSVLTSKLYQLFCRSPQSGARALLSMGDVERSTVDALEITMLAQIALCIPPAILRCQGALVKGMLSRVRREHIVNSRLKLIPLRELNALIGMGINVSKSNLKNWLKTNSTAVVIDVFMGNMPNIYLNKAVMSILKCRKERTQFIKHLCQRTTALMPVSSANTKTFKQLLRLIDYLALLDPTHEIELTDSFWRAFKKHHGLRSNDDVLEIFRHADLRSDEKHEFWEPMNDFTFRAHVRGSIFDNRHKNDFPGHPFDILAAYRLSNSHQLDKNLPRLLRAKSIQALCKMMIGSSHINEVTLLSMSLHYFVAIQRAISGAFKKGKKSDRYNYLHFIAFLCRIQLHSGAIVHGSGPAWGKILDITGSAYIKGLVALNKAYQSKGLGSLFDHIEDNKQYALDVLDSMMVIASRKEIALDAFLSAAQANTGNTSWLHVSDDISRVLGLCETDKNDVTFKFSPFLSELLNDHEELSLITNGKTLKLMGQEYRCCIGGEYYIEAGKMGTMYMVFKPKEDELNRYSWMNGPEVNNLKKGFICHLSEDLNILQAKGFANRELKHMESSYLEDLLADIKLRLNYLDA